LRKPVGAVRKRIPKSGAQEGEWIFPVRTFMDKGVLQMWMSALLGAKDFWGGITKCSRVEKRHLHSLKHNLSKMSHFAHQLTN